MSINIRKYVDLDNRYTLLGDNGYYISPFFIYNIVVDEVKLSMSFKKIKYFIENCEISLTEKEIKDFLDKKMDEENPTLREKLQNPYRLPKHISEWTKEDIDKAADTFGNSISKTRYEFEPYSLAYFKTYTSILKEKLQTLMEILEILLILNTEKNIPKESWKRLEDIDFHVNEYGDIYYLDLIRLADAIIYNVKNLYEKINTGNNLETYLTFKLSKHSMGRNGLTESEFYPSKEIQSKDLYYGSNQEFIALSDKQKEKLNHELQNTISKIVNIFENDISEEPPILERKK